MLVSEVGGVGKQKLISARSGDKQLRGTQDVGSVEVLHTLSAVTKYSQTLLLKESTRRGSTRKVAL
jgi:hypothetical protein